MPSQAGGDLTEDALDVVVGAHVARRHQLRPDRRRELADVALDPLALERERKLGALVGEPPRDRPGDRALVGDAQYERALAVEPAHGGESKAAGGVLSVLCHPCAASSDRLHSAWHSLPRRLRLRRFQPIERRHGEIEIPRVRAGTITVPDAHRRGRITVILTLADPPLAAYSRTLAGRSSARRLNTSSLAAKAYVAKLQRAQRAAAVVLKRAIPEAQVRRNYTILLNGMAVELPATELARAAKLSFARKLYPSYRYTLALNRSPGLIGATALAAAGGGTGEGMKIAVVDDGVDPDNKFFDPTGFSYPPGFPKGGAKWTTPKVIVARAFVGAGADERSRLALDRQASFHGTHVSGIAAGDAGTTAPAGSDHPEIAGLSGVAPRAQIGNYRVFNVPTPVGHVGNTPEIVAAFESAVRDGMDVINFSGGGPQTDPASDALVEAVRNVAAAGVVPVISAGNDRDDYGLGSAGSPGTAPDAISVAALSNSHVFAPALSVTAPNAPAALTRIPFARTAGDPTPAGWVTIGPAARGRRHA